MNTSNVASQPELTEPEIASYERQELTIETSFTQSLSTPSSASIKLNVAAVDSRRSLRRLLG